MREIKDLSAMRQYALTAKSRGKKIAFVPTMGALHEGHLCLVAEAKKPAEITIVSIFVNPIQFPAGEDFKRYPRDLRKDKKLLKSFEIDVLFLPEASAMFPAGFKTYVEVEGLSKKMCGMARPGHFRGVATVVAKLFNIVNPDIAIFGEKDYQQLLIIRQLVRDLGLPVAIISLPTVREFDGLAMSSRNAYLNPKERKSATILYRAISQVKEEIEKGERDLRKALFRIRSLIATEPGVRLDYAVIVEPDTLEEAKNLKGKKLIAVAANVGPARLIDNVIVET